VKGLLGFACYKSGMASASVVNNVKNSPFFGHTITMPVTVLDAPSLRVCGLRFYRSHSGSKCAGTTIWTRDKKILQQLKRKIKIKEPKNTLDKIDESKFQDVVLLVMTQPRNSGIKKKTPELFELPLGGTYEEKLVKAKELMDKEISVNDVFKEGELVDVAAVTKGKGFTGVVKRFGVKVQTRKNEKHHRHIGVHHAETPGKLDYRTPMAGQHGFHQRTELNKFILKINSEGKEVNPKGGWNGYGLIHGTYVLLAGSIPGPRKRLVFLKKSIRPKTMKELEFKGIIKGGKE